MGIFENRAAVRSGARKAMAVTEMARTLYALCPGAEPVTYDSEDLAIWGDIEGTAHWLFCVKLAELLIEAKEG